MIVEDVLGIKVHRKAIPERTLSSIAIVEDILQIGCDYGTVEEVEMFLNEQTGDNYRLIIRDVN